MAGSAFDTMQNNLFMQVTTLYGFDASWTPSTGGPTQNGKVLLKEPTDKDRINGVEYAPFVRFVEYPAGTFNGLLEISRDSSTLETIIVDGRAMYVKEVTAHYDGRTLKATCELVP